MFVVVHTDYIPILLIAQLPIVQCSMHIAYDQIHLIALSDYIILFYCILQAAAATTVVLDCVIMCIVEQIILILSLCIYAYFAHDYIQCSPT